MNRFIKRVDKVLSVISIVMVGLLSLGVVLTVILRYFFSLSFGWFEEFITMLFIYINFLCAAVCIREKQHINIPLLIDTFKGAGKIISEIFIQVVLIAVSVFLIISSIKWITSVGSTISPNSGIPVGYFYIIVPISSILSIFYAIINIISQFIKIDPAETGYFGDDYIPEETAK